MISATIEAVHTESDGTYGSPRMHADLPDHGLQASLNRVARIMRVAGLQGVSRRRGVRTTWRNKEDAPAGDLVNREFTATGPNQLWVADITCIPTWAGFLYLAVVLDVWSRRIVGWSMRTHLRTELVLEALDMALEQRRPESVIHHSDQGRPIHVLRLREAMRGRRGPPLHGVRRGRVRQRHGRVLLRQPRV